MINLNNKITFLISRVGPYWFAVITILLFALAGSAFDGISIGLLVPLLGSFQNAGSIEKINEFIRWLPEDLSVYSLHDQILIAILFVTIAIVLKNLTLAISLRLGAWLSTRISADLKSEAVNIVMSAAIDFHRRVKLGELMGKTIDCPIRAQDIVLALVHLVANVITFTVLLGLMFILSWQLSLISIFLGFGYLWFITLYMKKLAGPSKEDVRLNLETSHRLQESLAGIELIKAFCKESRVVDKLQDLIDKSRRLQSRIIFRSDGSFLVTDVLGAVAIGLICLSAIFVYDLNSSVLIPRLLPFLYIIIRLVPLARIVNQQKTRIIKGWPSFILIHELLRTDNKPFLVDGNESFSGLQNAIQFRQVSFVYGTEEKFALSNLDFAIPKGSITGLVGESGSGKTTVVNLLLRFYDPVNGEILFDGKPLQNFSLESYRRKISVVTQDTFIFHDTVISNIAFGLDEVPSKDKIVESARMAGAHDFIMQLSKGYDTLVGDRGVQLSGGQRQRISIARAILRDPEILILDEATSSVDKATERDIHRAIKDFSHNRTVVIVAHRMSTIEHADQIIVLKKGRIVETGNGKQLQQLAGEYSRLTLKQS